MEFIFNHYVLWVSENKLLSAAIQFGLLGTLGEFISHCFAKKDPKQFASFLVIIFKILAWALLGLMVKMGFVGMKGFVLALLDAGYLPDFCKRGFFYALTVSIMTNIFFGPQMMFFHRLEENLIARKVDFSGIQKAWWTLIWFWIPAHTLTFSLPVDFQIGLAALWSLVLGVILGHFASTKK